MSRKQVKHIDKVGQYRVCAPTARFTCVPKTVPIEHWTVIEYTTESSMWGDYVFRFSGVNSGECYYYIDERKRAFRAAKRQKRK